MSAQIYSGKEVAAALDEGTAQQVAELKAAGVQPTLAILRVGARPDDLSYEKGATKRAEKVGLAVRNVVLDEDVTQEDLLATVQQLNEDAGVHGVLMFRPLPKHLDEALICNALDPAKDIDGFTVGSLASVFSNDTSGFAPCTAQSCVEILNHYGVDLSGKRAVVVGRSLVIGKPVAMMLLARNATVTIAHSRTKDLPKVTSEADVVIACVGRAQMLTAEYFTEGQSVIDVGINFTDEGQLVGDVDTAAASEVVAGITPVPGGVGSVTTSVLCRHVVDAAKRLGGIDD